MKPSERRLLGITLALAAVFLAVQFGWNVEDVSGGGGGGSLDVARRTFAEYTRTLEEEPRIRREYTRIDTRSTNPLARGPREQFSDELYALLREFRFAAPQLDSPRFNPIENVEDYCTVDIQVQVTHMLPQLMQLLTEMTRRGMLVKEFTLSRANPRDPSQVALRVVVARVVKQTPETRRMLAPGGYVR